MGGAERGMFTLPPLLRMTDRLNVEITDTRAIGKDWRVIATVKHEE
jgi:diaminohydroxyphosphoribosylaminopyrimidine deaminase/5-amino-6-(5-phosphoribosylamino)uracil reductase